MTRKTKSGDPDKRRGGYRHGVPGGAAAKERVEVRVTPDVKERWGAAAVNAGFTGERDFAAAIFEFIERGIEKMSNIDTIELSDKSVIILGPVPRGMSRVDRLGYIQALIDESSRRDPDANYSDGRRWVLRPSDELIDMHRAVLRAVAPGHVSDDRDTIAALVSHYGIAHHLAAVGASLLSPTYAAALRDLICHPYLSISQRDGTLLPDVAVAYEL